MIEFRAFPLRQLYEGYHGVVLRGEDLGPGSCSEAPMKLI